MNNQDSRRLAATGVKMLLLFGSQAQGNPGETSDVDILVFGPDNKQVYDAVYGILAEKINRLIDFDIVFASRAPMELLNHASNHGQVIYSRHLQDFADFREKIMLMYSDFAPYRKMFQQATLERI